MDKWTKRDGIENHPAVTMRGKKAIIGWCDRCSGTGYLECFRHVANGMCFRCGGNGEVLFENSNIIERTVAYIEKAGIEGEAADRLFQQATNRFVNWLTKKQEDEAQAFALDIWNAGGGVDPERKYDSWFTCRVRGLVEDLYRTRGRSPSSLARETEARMARRALEA